MQNQRPILTLFHFFLLSVVVLGCMIIVIKIKMSVHVFTSMCQDLLSQWEGYMREQ